MRYLTMLRPVGIAVILFSACSPSAAPGGDEKSSYTLSGDRSTDEATLRRLREESRALAKTDGCAEGAACKTAPMGSKACGGPSSYVVYCSLTTDEAALLRKLEQLATFENQYNTKYGIVSTCEYITAPRVESVNGVCQAVP
jgi:hypothetical protein